MNLGDQFGLSLYNNGSTKAFVIETLEDKPSISESEKDPDPTLDILVEAIRFAGGELDTGMRVMTLSEIRAGLTDDIMLTEVLVDGRQATIGRLIEVAAEGAFLADELQDDITASQP